jgi:hypothetical protein
VHHPGVPSDGKIGQKQLDEVEGPGAGEKTL